MDEKFKESIEEAKNYISKIDDVAHGIYHIKQVVDNSLLISMQFPEVDPKLIEVAAWWHDVGRLYNDAHEEISAKMAYESLLKLDVPNEICQKVHDAIIFHKYSMNPKTIEGEIIRDADKLEFIGIPKWKICIEKKEYYWLEDIARLLPKLRDEFLHLEVSKKIYDKQIVEFIDFIKTVDDKDFEKTKIKILSYDLV